MVPISLANPQNIKLYGELIETFDPNLVKILQWPSKQRPVWMGDECGVTIQKNVYQWSDNGTISFADNIVGYRNPSDLKILTNYMFLRLDGSHLFFSESNKMFCIILALGKKDDQEEIDPRTFTSLAIPSGRGILIKENVWRSVAFPFGVTQIVLNETFSSIDARVEDDLFASFGFVLEVVGSENVMK